MANESDDPTDRLPSRIIKPHTWESLHRATNSVGAILDPEALMDGRKLCDEFLLTWMDATWARPKLQPNPSPHSQNVLYRRRLKTEHTNEGFVEACKRMLQRFGYTVEKK